MVCAKLLFLCAVALLLVAISAGPARKRPGKGKKPGKSNNRDFMKYLRKFGFLGRGRASLSDSEIEEALKAFQRGAGIPATGQVDLSTETMMNTPRCGKMDLAFTTLNSGWGHKDLTYRIDQYPAETEMPRAVVDVTIAQAFKIWSDVTTLTFKAEASGTVDIVILFVSGSHGDGSDFDGPGSVLAHAFSPYTGPNTVDSIHGDAHFDDGETWTINVDYGVNLLWVAVHEFGHSLGLGHSAVRDAIMYPYYGGYVEDFKLDQDDIKGIQTLYGGSSGTTQAPSDTTTTAETTTAETTTTDPAQPSPPAPTPTAPSNCTDTGFFEWEGVKRQGRKRIPSISNIEDCQARCAESPSCWAFSYNDVRRADVRCFTHSLKTSYAKKLDFYFKKYTSDSTTYYEASEFTKHQGGMRVEELVPREECQEMCDFEEHCIGYSYTRVTSPKRRWWCKLHIAAVAGKPRKFDHYVKYSC